MTQAQERLIDYMEGHRGLLICMFGKGKPGVASLSTIKSLIKAGILIRCTSIFTRGLQAYALADRPLPEDYVRC